MRESDTTTSSPKTIEDSGGLNYLLITPRISLLPYPNNLERYGYLPNIPMGLAYISSSLKTVSQNVYNLNLEFETGGIYEAITDSIEKHHIDVVLTGGMSGQFSKVKKVVDSVKQIKKNLVMVVGGGVISSAPDVAMKAFECVDIGVIGEGEITVRELVLALNSGKDLKTINGLIYKKDGGFVSTAPRQEIADLNTLPLPDYKGVGCDKLWKFIQTSYIVPSRSCPFNCTFCYHPSGGKYRMRSVDNVIGEIKFLVENYQIRHIGLFDELFATGKSKVIEFCTKVKPYNITWSCTVHPATFHGELLQLMRESGCRHINIGVESASEKVLKSMNKRTTLQKTENALKIINESKIGINAALLFGDVAEDTETVEETLHWWRSNLQYAIELTRLYVFPGSFVYNYAVKEGIIKNEVEHLRNDCRNANVSKLTDYQYNEMLLRLTTEEAFYSYQPKGFSIVSVNTTAQKTSAIYECFCGYKGDIITVGLLLSNTFHCPVCIQGYRLPLYEKYSFSHIRNKVESVIKETGNIAFWGLGREMQLLLRGIDVSTIKEAFIIDRDAKKQGLHFMGKLVHAPNIFQKEDIATVVPTPLLVGGIHYNETIEAEIAKFSKGEILPLGELLRQGVKSSLHEYSADVSETLVKSDSEAYALQH